MTLLSDLDAFLQKHRRCGEIDAEVEGDRIWMTCTCGAVISRTPAAWEALRRAEPTGA